MKKFLTLLFLLPLLVFGQLTMSELGLPEEALTYSNSVIQSCEFNLPKVVPVTNRTTGARTYIVQWTKSRPGFTGYALNFIHGYVHDFSHEYVGMVGGWHTFHKAGFKFTTGGVEYTIDPQYLYIKKDSAGLTTFKLVTETSTYYSIVDRKSKAFTADEVAGYAKVSKQVLWERDADYWYAQDRNPSTHITSAFTTVDYSNGQFTGKFYVNLQEYVSGYGSKITCYNKSGASFIHRWKLYNSCTKANATNGGSEAGSAGMCEVRVVNSQSFSPQTFTWDASREFIVVEFEVEEYPAQGKNSLFESYYILQGCDEDDPCGPARRPVMVAAR